MAAPQIENHMGMPVSNPRQKQQGISELDYRNQGGFVPSLLLTNVISLQIRLVEKGYFIGNKKGNISSKNNSINKT